MSGNSKQALDMEAQRMKRLNQEDCWDAIGVTFEEWKAQRRKRSQCGVYRCPCGTHYDPTYGHCPTCQRFTGAPADWPNEAAVTVIEAQHRGPQVEAVSWNTGPYLFDEVER